MLYDKLHPSDALRTIPGIGDALAPLVLGVYCMRLVVSRIARLRASRFVPLAPTRQAAPTNPAKASPSPAITASNEHSTLRPMLHDGSIRAGRGLLAIDGAQRPPPQTGFVGTDKLAGVLSRLEQRRCRLEQPRDPRSMGLFRRLVREALPESPLRTAART